MIGLELLACAPNVAPYTTQEIIRVESSFNPIAVNVNVRKVNGKRITYRIPQKIRTADDAIRVTKQAISAGHSVDMGYMQVNSVNLKSLGYTVDEMFKEPCKNIAAGGKILTAFYSKAARQYPDQQTALKAALSAYNTGNFRSGFNNGYVARFVKSGKSSPVPSYRTVSVSLAPQSVANPFSNNRSETSIFHRPTEKELNMSKDKIQTASVMPVISRSPKDAGTPGVQVQYSADAAELNGAFQETALSEGDAWESNSELAQNIHETALISGGKLVK